tara:strand:- start:19194 stop:21542 length:2349 start_codon:yes stop_codon:yes gene_type:complete
MLNPDYIEKILSFPYKLDEFQKNSIDSILKNENVLVTAHTSAGKSTIAEFAIALSLSKNKRTIYTSPIKALSNQKYGDFQKKKGICNNSIGILTGDIKVNPDANVLVATTEIVNNLLYKNIEYFDNVDSIVLDEVHYIRDKDRGHVWEEVISMMPKHVTLVMLSASIPGAEGFRDWVSKIKGINCNLISTSYRPVPLHHNIYWNGYCERIIDSKNNVDTQVYKNTYNNYRSYMLQKSKDKDSVTTLLKNFTKYLEDKELFPALFFVFSRKQTEKLGSMIQRSFISGKEQTECINLFEYYVKKYLGESGLQLSQVWMIRSLLSKGVCVHHSGLIPILKEIIETIFEKGWIKLMFVTETFSVGINMPTKCVVFGELSKFDGKENRCVNPEEYCQMAGRAGRRGKDTQGIVIYLPLPPKDMLRLDEFIGVVKGKHSNVVSKFKMDPVIMLKCVEMGESAEDIFDNTLMSKEIVDCVTGLNYELEVLNKKLRTYEFISRKDEENYTILMKEEFLLKSVSGNKRKKISNRINKIKNEFDSNLDDIKMKQSIVSDINKIIKNINDANVYISETCKWHQTVLLNTGYLIENDGNIAISLKGRGCSSINESDSFLTIEYLTSLFENLSDYSDERLRLCIPFILGSMIDEKELNKDDIELNTNTIYGDILQNKDNVYIVEKEMSYLQELYDTLSLEERLRDNDYKLTPIFGCYVYLWTVSLYSYNDIVQKICSSLYEGNFVRNMLKVHNICEEWKNVADMYQNNRFAGIIQDIQKNIIRDIVIIDSLYIQS